MSRTSLADLAGQSFLIDAVDSYWGPAVQARGPDDYRALVPWTEAQFDDQGDFARRKLDDIHGVMLYAIAALPEIASLLCWLHSEFDGSDHDAAELASRLARIFEIVDDRPDTLEPGIHEIGETK